MSPLHGLNLHGPAVLQSPSLPLRPCGVLTSKNVISTHGSHRMRHPRTCTAPMKTAAPMLSGAGLRQAPALAPAMAPASTTGTGLFPAGQKQATVELPSLMLQLDAKDVCDPTTGSTVIQAVNEAVAAGATAVILADTGNQAGAATLYEAACKMKATLRGRAALLLLDRTDIASAAEADGVLLTSQGVPITVAQRILPGSILVGRACTSVQEAVKEAAEGANFVLLSSPDGSFPDAASLVAARQKQRSGNAIPVLAAAGIAGPGMSVAVQPLPADCWTSGNLDGLALPLSALTRVAADAGGPAGAGSRPEEVGQAVAWLLERLRQLPVNPGVKVDVGGGSAMQRRLHSRDREQLVQEESVLLTRALSFLEVAAPEMGEINLLKDSLAQLDDAFLAVVVGEFNSGKSSLINALLGGRFLAEGILPTTNEISILKHRSQAVEGAPPEPELVQQSDGLFVRYLPARLLEELNIVDTPGTNVILSRQQRLTEEYVPRADLVLFVMSADRPFSESEVKFLEYIRQWKKKIVFVVNKKDLLDDKGQVDEVKAFVSENASRLLKLDSPSVLAVSSRTALRAKLTSGGGGGGSLDGDNRPSFSGIKLGSNKEWMESGFAEFEAFIYSFLVGAGATEGLRLKLQTPVAVADALLEATGRKLEENLRVAQEELTSLESVSVQLERFEADMTKDFQVQVTDVQKVVDEALVRSDRFIDRTLQLSKIIEFVPYWTAPTGTVSPLRNRFETEVAGSTMEELRSAVQGHSSWLRRNCDSQIDYYSAFLDERARSLGLSGASIRSIGTRSMSTRSTSSSYTDSDDGGEALSSSDGGTRRGAPSASASLASTSGAGWGGVQPSAALAAVNQFNVRAAATLLDQELRENLTGTATFSVGAPVGVLVASMLPSTLEDLFVLGLGGLASYMAVLNMPKRRENAKAKVAKVAKNFATDVSTKMEEEMLQQVGQVTEVVRSLVGPLLSSCAFEVQRLEALEETRKQLVAELAALDRRFASIE